MSRFAYVNGSFVRHGDAAVHIEDRGFQFADGIYEVFALIDGRIADEVGHLDRMERSLRELHISMPLTRRALGLAMRELLRRNRITDAMIYLQITRGVAPRDFSIPKDIKPSLIMTVRPLRYDIEARKLIARKVATVPDMRWKRCDIKTTMLLPAVLAKQMAKEKGADEAWLVDEKGFVTEASSSNAWIVDDKGHLITRPTRGKVILKGVTRNVVQVLCKKDKIKIIERPFTVKEAYKAKEAFTSAATALFVSVVEIDGRKIGNGKPGTMVSRLYDVYMNYCLKGKKQEHWTEE